MNKKTAKHIITSLLAVSVLLISCTNNSAEQESSNQQDIKIVEEINQQENPIKEEPVGIQLQYTNTINNYNIHVDWYPHLDISEEAINGKGIIHFNHTSGFNFSIEHNNFLLSKDVPIEFDNNSIILPIEKPVNMEYIPYPEDELFINTELPFIFYDTNFDGNQEIVLIHPSGNEQTEDSLTFFAINNPNEAKLPSHQIKRDIPYCYIKSNTEFNRENKTVTLHFTKNGITEKRIYKHNTELDDLQFELAEGKYKEFSYAFNNSEDDKKINASLDKFHEEISNNIDLYSTELMKRTINN